MECWICGDEATETRIIKRSYLGRSWENVELPVSPYSRCYCSKCKKQIEKQEAEEHNIYVRLKKIEMFKKAVCLLESQNTLMYEYKEAIEVVKEHLENNLDKYDSSYEVLASIILVHNRIYSKRQYRIGKYEVDFILPEHGVILEIDGERHQHRKTADSERDKTIKSILGNGWEILRIKTDYLDMNAKQLPYAIERLVEYRKTNKINWRTL